MSTETKQIETEIETKDILQACDHTLLLQASTWEEIQGICDDAMRYHTASV